MTNIRVTFMLTVTQSWVKLTDEGKVHDNRSNFMDINDCCLIFNE